MVNLQIYTTDVGPGDGGLVLVPGSHKVRACLLPPLPQTLFGFRRFRFRLPAEHCSWVAALVGGQANLYPTDEMLELEEDSEITFSPVLSAGDAVLFSE